MLKPINKVIRIIIYWDFFFNSAWGLLGPIFAIFIVQKITFQNTAQGAEVAGFAALIFWALKSFLQIPIGGYLDKNHGEKDDFLFMILGTFMTGLVPFGFIFSSIPEHIYLLQVLHAIGMSMIVPSSYAIFTRHIDKGKEAYEWSVDSTILGFGVGATGAIGGLMVSRFGFSAVFIIAGALNLISAFLLLIIEKYMSPRTIRLHKIPPVSPPKAYK